MTTVDSWSPLVTPAFRQGGLRLGASRKETAARQCMVFAGGASRQVGEGLNECVISLG